MGNTGLNSMIDENRVEDMSRLFKVFGLVPAGLPALKRELKIAVETRGNIINQFEEDIEQRLELAQKKVQQDKSLDAIKWVQGVLDLRDQFMSILNCSFDSDPLIEEAIGEVSASTRQQE